MKFYNKFFSYIWKRESWSDSFKSKKLSLQGFMKFLFFFLIINIIDFLFFSSFLLVFYEAFLNLLVLFKDYFIYIFRCSLVYIFIYFLVCLCNIYYLGYKKFRFFGLNLDDYKIIWRKYFWFLIEFNYFFLVSLHILLLNLIIYLSYDSYFFFYCFCLFYVFLWLSIKIKKWIDTLDKDYDINKIFIFSFNTALIIVLGVYINLIIEYLLPVYIFKLQNFDYFYKFFETKMIYNLNHAKYKLKWFSLLTMNKEFYKNVAFFRFKQNFNNEYILNEWNSSFKKPHYTFTNKDVSKSLLEWINDYNKNILDLHRQNLLLNLNLNHFNRSLNIVNNNVVENLVLSYYVEDDLRKFFKLQNLTASYLKFNFNNFLYNKLNFLIQNKVEVKYMYPVEKNEKYMPKLKLLLARDNLNYNYLLVEIEEDNFENYQVYIDNCNKEKKFYFNLFTNLLIKKPLRFYHLIKFDNYYLENLMVKIGILVENKRKSTSLFDFNYLMKNYDSEVIKDIFNFYIDLLKIDLYILNWEEKHLQIKKILFKDYSVLYNFNVDKVIKNIYNNVRLKQKQINIIGDLKNKVLKQKFFFNVENLVDFNELFFNDFVKYSFFTKKKFLKSFSYDFLKILNPYRKPLPLEKLNDIKNLKLKNDNRLDFINKKLLKIYGNSVKKMLFTKSELDYILNSSFFIEKQENNSFTILELKHNKLKEIGLEAYYKKLFKIKLYNYLIYIEEDLFRKNYTIETHKYNNFSKKFISFFFNKKLSESFLLNNLKEYYFKRVLVLKQNKKDIYVLKKFLDSYNYYNIIINSNKDSYNNNELVFKNTKKNFKSYFILLKDFNIKDWIKLYVNFYLLWNPNDKSDVLKFKIENNSRGVFDMQKHLREVNWWINKQSELIKKFEDSMYGLLIQYNEEINNSLLESYEYPILDMGANPTNLYNEDGWSELYQEFFYAKEYYYEVEQNAMLFRDPYNIIYKNTVLKNILNKGLYHFIIVQTQKQGYNFSFDQITFIYEKLISIYTYQNIRFSFFQLPFFQLMNLQLDIWENEFMQKQLLLELEFKSRIEEEEENFYQVLEDLDYYNDRIAEFNCEEDEENRLLMLEQLDKNEQLFLYCVNILDYELKDIAQSMKQAYEINLKSLSLNLYLAILENKILYLQQVDKFIDYNLNVNLQKEFIKVFLKNDIEKMKIINDFTKGFKEVIQNQEFFDRNKKFLMLSEKDKKKFLYLTKKNWNVYNYKQNIIEKENFKFLNKVKKNNE